MQGGFGLLLHQTVVPVAATVIEANWLLMVPTSMMIGSAAFTVSVETWVTVAPDASAGAEVVSATAEAAIAAAENCRGE